jgi:cell division protein FtsI (penicillin-binding protein 3)
MAFRPVSQLPETLPEGAHRVIRELTAAKMRAMMQGIVTEGTGKAAQLNGYSSAGKTGTAQKIDVATHTYSHTKLVASFAGFAPVSNPAIAVTVVIDNPTVGASKYGGAVSAPVFAQVAQQVLEYLGVPHDRPLTQQKGAKVASEEEVADDSPNENTGDLEAMFADVNNLPADDPLRASATQDAAQSPAPAPNNVTTSSGVKNSVMQLLPKKVADAFRANGGSNATAPEATSASLVAPKIMPEAQTRGNGTVVVDSVKRVAVPSFEGAALRTVVEEAGRAGLRVQPLGSGLARQQVPVAGTMVPEGTQVAVRFSR